MNTTILVFSGYNPRAVVSFLRVLTKNRIDNYVIVASSVQDCIFKTVYSKKVICTRKNQRLDKLEIFDILTEICIKMKAEYLLIPPVSEFLNRFFLKYREEFERRQCIIPLVKKSLYEAISDKESFWNICKEAGFIVPQQIPFTKEFTQPYAAKPKKYFSHNVETYSPVLVFSEQEHKEFWDTYKKEDFTFQEYILGESYYLLFYFSKDGQVHAFSQINYAQQPFGKSILAAKPADLHIEPVAINYIKFFKKLGYFGFLMLELRKCGEKYYMIEANPRFWGPSQLFVDSGIPFFELFLKDYGVIENIKKTDICYEARYLWSGGCKENLLHSDNCVWLGDGKQKLTAEWEQYKQADIYRREDTMKIFEIERLKNLYSHVSKHSNYQILTDELAVLLNQDHLHIKSRQERERFDYMLRHVDFQGKNVLDIGGNTGYFTFEIIKNGAEHVDYYEGNREHAEFVALAAKILGVEEKITIYPEYYMFCEKKHQYDIVLNLNIVHHLGDDFKKADKKENAKKEMLTCINGLSYCTDLMIFQMGYNWKGDARECLFENGTKGELELYLEEGTKEYWKIVNTGIATDHHGIIRYEEKTEANNIRKNELGEFLNRPIFIMRTKKEIDI